MATGGGVTTVTKVEIHVYESKDGEKYPVVERIFHRSGSKAWTHTLAEKDSCEICGKGGGKND